MKNLFLTFTAIAFVSIAYFASCAEKEIKTTEIVRSPAEFESGPKPTVVAVIDTGFDMNSNWKAILKAYPKYRKPRICKYGSKDYTGVGLVDNHGHGTHIAGLIAQYADDSNYCLVILKYFDPKVKNDNLENTRLSFERAIKMKVDIINYSGGGEDYSEQECTLIKKALDQGIKVVAAAGNEGKNIDVTPYYPAMCDSRVIVVANYFDDKNRVSSSNYSTGLPGSKIMVHEMGWNVMSLAPNNQLVVMTGTSQATAIKTGKIIRSMKKP